MDQEYSHRGTLKIFLGYAAGVGKTYAMLDAAQRKKVEGVDVVIGVAVTHGRKETERLLEGLEVLPLQKREYKGVELSELDIDAVLERKPALILVDELAHSNIPGSRHNKRYMDVEEILKAGIDVYTTLNIQHLESFQDPIEQVTGVLVRERVPDRILDSAEEIELVDIAPEELLERLRQGKVYVPEQALRAIQRFFRKENLQLLREIAMRKAAAIVDTERGKYPQDQMTQAGIAPKLLASIGPSPFSERVIRVTKRLADMLKAEWLVAFVETPEAAFRSEQEKTQVSKHIKLAEELGGKVVVLPGESIADTIYDYAKGHGVTQIVMGHSLTPWYKRLFHRSPVDELVRKGGAIDVYVISSHVGEPVPVRPRKKKIDFFSQLGSCCFLPIALVSFLTVLLLMFSEWIALSTIALIYLVSSAVAALFFQPICFYVYLITTIFMLDAVFFPSMTEWMENGELFVFSLATFIVGIIVNHLTYRQRRLAKAVVLRHREVLRLYELSRDLAAASGPQAVLSKLNQHLDAVSQAEAVLYIKQNGSFQKIGGSLIHPFDVTEETAARWATEHKEAAGYLTDTLPFAKGVFLPLIVSERSIGALGIYSKTMESLPNNRDLLEAFAHLVAISLDRTSMEGS